MAKYIGKRLIYMAVTLFVVAALTFTLMKILPGSPFDEERFLRLEEAKQAEALARYGLDKPVPVQFARYIGNMLKGDFGISFYYTNDHRYPGDPHRAGDRPLARHHRSLPA